MGLFNFLLRLAAALQNFGSAILLPSQHPWYKPPPDIKSHKPGTVISSREIDTNLQGILPRGPTPNVHTAWQYMYRSTDSLGNPVADVATLLVPKNADPKKLLVFQSIYDSANADCGANTTSIDDVLFIAAALNKGWYVLGADYECLEGHVTAGVQSGYATLDGVRAALNAAPTNGLSKHARYALWGYSGGAIATEFAVELQPKYAPELNFAGAAIGGLTPSIETVLDTISETKFAGLAIAGVKGMSRAYPNFTRWLDHSPVPSKKAQFESIAKGCLSGASKAATNMDVFTFVKNGRAAMKEAIPRSVFEKGGTMGVHGVPTMPLFLYQGVMDQTSPIGETDKLFDKLCKHDGVNIQYQKDVVADHVSEALLGSLDAFQWLTARLEGKAIKNKGCKMNRVFLTDLDPGSLDSMDAHFQAVFAAFLGHGLGRPWWIG
ncbi:Lipase A [Fulvia fulva]|uniref:Lipase A n=1 Tax=Passalora fulva TaxID=5499 RepID=A0A9Q8P5I2_PASFU|nr:Lipase A [Fulvia fulva]UJO14023.1 Lipase A [Fulvia fulva]